MFSVAKQLTRIHDMLHVYNISVYEWQWDMCLQVLVWPEIIFKTVPKCLPKGPSPGLLLLIVIHRSCSSLQLECLWAHLRPAEETRITYLTCYFLTVCSATVLC